MRVFHRRLEPTEEGAKQELHFSFDAEIDGEAQIFWECVDMTLPDVLEQPANLKKLGLDLQRKKGDAKPKWFRFKKGLGQSWHGAPIRSSKAGSASMGREVKVDGGHGLVVYPLVVRLRGIVAGQGEQSEVRTTPLITSTFREVCLKPSLRFRQTTFAVLHKSGRDSIAPKCKSQKVLCDGRIYETQEVYGATGDDGAPHTRHS